MTKEDQDLADEFNRVIRNLKESGVNLRNIRIALKKDALGSYITRRIREEMEKDHEPQNISDYPDIP